VLETGTGLFGVKVTFFRGARTFVRGDGAVVGSFSSSETKDASALSLISSLLTSLVFSFRIVCSCCMIAY
jgi:hypothetical protein